MIGKTIGPYQVIDKLGEGGMGEVYRARDTRLDREVAVKVLSSQLATDPMAITRFQREARAVAALSHPNILSLYDVGVADGLSFVVTELLEGQNLRERLQAGPIHPNQAIQIGIQVVRGLAAAHEKGIVHRDLKPENVFVTAAGHVKILDFGLARQSVRTGGHSMAQTAAQDTSPGTVLGTVGYMSPEQVRGLDTDHRTDLFAMGTVLYEMLGGRRAFEAQTAADTMAAIVRDVPPDLTALNPSLPAPLTRIVTRCLDKDPAARFQSAHDLAFALESLSQHASARGLEPPAIHEEAKSIVVLPFEDLSPDRDNAFFSDGLTDEIISDLSRIGGLRVISRNSSMQLKGRQHDIATIGRDLKVQYVLDGSVRKAGSKLRITAQLVDAATNTQTWADKYNGTLDDIFEIQEQVSRAIARELKGHLTKEESRELARRPITDARAYELYLRARAKSLKFTAETLHEALVDIDAGLAITGDNAQLLGTLGDVQWWFHQLGIITDKAQLQKVADLASRIELLEPRSPHASRLRALVAVNSGDLQESTRQIKRSLADEPNDSFTSMFYVCCCVFAGRGSAALDVARRVRAFDPLNGICGWLLPMIDYFDGRFERAAADLRQPYASNPTDAPVALFYSQSMAATGRTEEAFNAIDRLAEVGPKANWTVLCLLLKAALQGDETTVNNLVTPEFAAWCADDPQYALMVAEIYALVKRADDAFLWLERFLATGGCAYHFVANYDPFLANVRSDARWPALMARMKVAYDRFEV